METKNNVESVTELTRKGTCIEFFSAYQDLETDRMIGLCDPNGEVWFKPLGEDGRGTIGGLGRNLWSLLMDCFPDIDNTIDTMETEDDSVVCKVVIFGTQAKDFAGIPSKGLRFNSDHIFIFRFNEADKVISITIDWDHQRFQQQLGAL
ncbi:hypothetical protein GCM10023189_51420 [Nibrella saemangeumensis]|uniref:Nuclear transport factor 2 family protein n=1 Tax=Nibrella saemangeumensis TaxID=1084526 RepID=A0ABP8NLW6_9BACT